MFSKLHFIIYLSLLALQAFPLLVQANVKKSGNTDSCKTLVQTSRGEMPLTFKEKLPIIKNRLNDFLPKIILGVSRSDLSAMAAVDNDLQILLIHHQLIHSRFFHAMALKVARENRGEITPFQFEAQRLISMSHDKRLKIATEIYNTMEEVLLDLEADKKSLTLLTEDRAQSMDFFNQVPRERMISDFSIALLHWANIVNKRHQYFRSNKNALEQAIADTLTEKRWDVLFTHFSEESLFIQGKTFKEVNLGLNQENVFKSDWQNILNGQALKPRETKFIVFSEDMTTPSSQLWLRYYTGTIYALASLSSLHLSDGLASELVSLSFASVAAWSFIYPRQYSRYQRQILRAKESRDTYFSNDDSNFLKDEL